MTYFDLSSNALTSNMILEVFAQLVLLRYLNLSNNMIGGAIPYSLGTNMLLLESLDLSRNNLISTIPSSLGFIKTLPTINFSYNNLEGAFPIAIHFTTFNNASYPPRNSRLCGNVMDRPFSQSTSTFYGAHNGTRSKLFGDIASWVNFEVGLGLGVGSRTFIIIYTQKKKIIVWRPWQHAKKVKPTAHYRMFKTRTWYCRLPIYAYKCI